MCGMTSLYMGNDSQGFNVLTWVVASHDSTPYYVTRDSLCMGHDTWTHLIHADNSVP